MEDVDTDSQRTKFKNGNPHINYFLNTNKSDNWADENFSKEMFLTEAYVKNECTSTALDDDTLNCTRHDCIHGQQLTGINVIKTEKTESCSDDTSGEKTEACTDNTPGNVTVEEHGAMKVKVESEYYHIKEHDIHHVTDISQHFRVGDEDNGTMHVKEESKHSHTTEYDINHAIDYRNDDEEKSQNHHNKEQDIHHVTDIWLGENDTINMEDNCPSSATQSRYKCFEKRVPSGEKRFKCDLCAYSARTSWHLKRHKLIHTGEKPYMCDLCDYSASQSGDLKTHTLIHTGEKPYKCDVCDYSSTKSGNLKRHKLIH